jgi:putative tricarboxylic transport membrane protein
MLFVTSADVVWNVIAVDLVATFVMFAMMIGLVRVYIRVIAVPKGILLPIITLCCIVGVYSLNNTMFDVWTMLAFGVLGFFMERGGFALGPFVIGYVLAPIAESSLREGLMITDGKILPLFTDPLSAIMLAIAAFMLVWQIRSEYKRRRVPAATV